MQTRRRRNIPICSRHRKDDRSVVTTGVIIRMVALRFMGVLVTVRYSVSIRKQFKRPDTNSLHRVPDGPSGLHFVTINIQILILSCIRDL